MAEKTVLENSQAKKERFEFVLTVNDNIICQRYFRINNFKKKSLGSVQLVEAIENCVELVKNDLKEKSNIYLWYTSPQVFQDREEMERWLSVHGTELEVPQYIVLRENEEVLVWDGCGTKPYNKPFNISDYIQSGSVEQTPSIFKFSFIDNGENYLEEELKEEIRTVTWEGNAYPKFVRSNIDISNTKNKYKNSSIYAPMEEFMLDRYISSLNDIIPVIVKKICNVCSKNDSSIYDSCVKYGDKVYDLNIFRQNEDYYRSMESFCNRRAEA